MPNDDRAKNVKEYQWAPGQSGNPAGRPKGSVNKKTILRSILDIKINNESVLIQKLRAKFPELFTDDRAEYSLEFIISLRHVLRAITGSEPDRAIIDILDRMHGRPIQSFNLMDSKESDGENLTTEQIRDQLKQVRSLRDSFDRAKRHTTDQDGKPDAGGT